MKKAKLSFFLSFMVIIILVIAFFLHNNFIGAESIFKGNSVSQNDIDRAPDLKLNIIADEYRLSATIGEGLGLKQPQGIALIDEDLLIADTSNNRLVLIDVNGKMKKEIGKMGNGAGEFVNPTGITVDNEGYVYVLDSGNSRIQVFDKSFKFIKQIAINVFDGKSVNLMDLVVDSSKNIYFSVETYDRKLGSIYIISSDDNKVKKIGEGLLGHLAIENDIVYFVSGGEYYNSGKYEGVRSGKNELLHIIDKEIKKVYELPYKYVPKGIVIDNDNMYLVSGAFITVDRFDLQANYIGTVYKGDFKEQQGITYIVKDSKNDLYVLDTFKNVIYKLSKND